MKANPATWEAGVAGVRAAGDARSVFHVIALATVSSNGAAQFLNNALCSEDAETGISSVGDQGTARDKIKSEAVR